MAWIVLDRGAYADWVRRDSPSIDCERDMLGWFDYLEDQATPPSVDGYSAAGVPVTTGPNGEVVEFELRHNPSRSEPVRGVIILRSITTEARN